MYDALYYIFSAVIIIASLYLLFSKNLLNSLFAILVTLLACSGFYVLLNSELVALLNILAITILASILLGYLPYFKNLLMIEEINDPKPNFTSLILISLLTAIISSLIASTRWPAPDINFEITTFALLFTKYLPVILAVIIMLSVFITCLSYMLKKTKSIS